MPVQDRRLLLDGALSVSAALPAAGANNRSDALDLGLGPFRPEELNVEISIPALPSLANGAAVTIQLLDSGDGVNFTAVGPLHQTSVTGADGAGSAEKTVAFMLPPEVRQFIAFSQAVDEGGGNNTAASITYRLRL